MTASPQAPDQKFAANATTGEDASAYPHKHGYDRARPIHLFSQ